MSKSDNKNKTYRALVRPLVFIAPVLVFTGLTWFHYSWEGAGDQAISTETPQNPSEARSITANNDSPTNSHNTTPLIDKAPDQAAGLDKAIFTPVFTLRIGLYSKT